MNKERLIELPEITDERGTLSFAETGQHFPFNISYISWITEKHVLEQGEVLLIALSGSFNVIVDNKIYSLQQRQKTLYIPESEYCEVTNFSNNAICLIISSEPGKSCLEKKYLSLKSYSISDCIPTRLKNNEENNNLIKNIPFDTQRIFYIYNIPQGEQRGMHAHKLCHEVLIAIKGRFDVELDDGTNKKTISLDSPEYGLHIPPGIWAVERNYSSDTICLVFASDSYDTENYINSYSEFIKYRQDEN